MCVPNHERGGEDFSCSAIARDRKLDAAASKYDGSFMHGYIDGEGGDT